MASKPSQTVNLKQYRRIGGKWQFVPVGRGKDGKPDPRFVIISGEPANSKGGTFYLDWREDGKRKQKPCGTTPREACRLRSRRTTGRPDSQNDLLRIWDKLHGYLPYSSFISG